MVESPGLTVQPGVDSEGERRGSVITLELVHRCGCLSGGRATSCDLQFYALGNENNASCPAWPHIVERVRGRGSKCWPVREPMGENPVSSFGAQALNVSLLENLCVLLWITLATITNTLNCTMAQIELKCFPATVLQALSSGWLGCPSSGLPTGLAS